MALKKSHFWHLCKGKSDKGETKEEKKRREEKERKKGRRRRRKKERHMYEFLYGYV